RRRRGHSITSPFRRIRGHCCARGVGHAEPSLSNAARVSLRRRPWPAREPRNTLVELYRARHPSGRGRQSAITRCRCSDGRTAMPRRISAFPRLPGAGRPAAPKDLSEREREIWIAAVESRPLHYFDAPCLPLLAAFCVHATIVEELSAELRARPTTQ